MKKKLTAFILALTGACAFTLASCGGSGAGNGAGNSVPDPQSSQDTPTPKTDEEKITATVNKFAKEYNDGNFEGVLECLEPKMRNAMQALFNTLGGIAGGKLGVDISLSDLFSLGVAMEDGDFITFSIQDIAIGDGKASVTAHMNLAPATTETMYVILVEEDGEWLIENITDKKSSIGSGKNVVVTELGKDGFVDGLAKITYEQDGQEFWGLINTDGEVIYSQEGTWNEWHHMGNGAGWISDYDYKTDTSEYQIINAQGEILATNVNGEFDRLIYAENGLAWVYKYQSGINGAKAFYGVIGSNGEWVAPMTETDFSYQSGGSTETYMLGEDYFVNYYYSWGDNYIVYNYKTGVTYEIESGHIKGEIDGLIYGRGGEISYNNEDSDDLPDYYCLKPDGTVEELSEFTSVTGDWLVLDEDSSSSNVVLRNVKTKEVFEYTAYDSHRVLEIISVESGFLVLIEGLDGNRYFTLLDEDGNQRFEPIRLKYKYGSGDFVYIVYTDNMLVYLTKDGWDSTHYRYAVANAQGEVVVPESAGYCYIGAFSDGLAVAQIGETEEWVVIDTQGNVVIENFYVNE